MDRELIILIATLLLSLVSWIGKLRQKRERRKNFPVVPTAEDSTVYAPSVNPQSVTYYDSSHNHQASQVNPEDSSQEIPPSTGNVCTRTDFLETPNNSSAETTPVYNTHFLDSRDMETSSSCSISHYPYSFKEKDNVTAETTSLLASSATFRIPHEKAADDFDLERAIVYQAILQPKFKEY